MRLLSEYRKKAKNIIEGVKEIMDDKPETDATETSDTVLPPGIVLEQQEEEERDFTDIDITSDIGEGYYGDEPIEWPELPLFHSESAIKAENDIPIPDQEVIDREITIMLDSSTGHEEIHLDTTRNPENPFLNDFEYFPPPAFAQDKVEHPIDDKIKLSLPSNNKLERPMNLILSPKDNTNKIVLENVETFALEGDTLLVVFNDGTFRNYPLVHLWWYGGALINNGGPRSKPFPLKKVAE